MSWTPGRLPFRDIRPVRTVTVVGSTTVPFVGVVQPSQVSEYTTAASAMAFDEEKRQSCTMEAWRAGLVGGFQALAVSGPITYLADRKWAAFRNRLGVSGKVATAISPFFAMFYLRSEQVILECARRGRTIESYRGE